MNVTLRQLRVFTSIVKRQNFTRAGDDMGLTQSAVSRAIVELESLVGVRLIDRTTREVSLTRAGRALAARLDRVLEDLDQALGEVAGLADAKGGNVCVASSSMLSANLMPACIATCAIQAPGIRFMLLDRTNEDVLESVRIGQADFGVVIEPSSTIDLHFEVVLNDSFLMIAPIEHPLAHEKSLHWTALNGAELVLLDYASGSRRLIDQAFARHAVSCEVKQEVGHPTTVLGMVEAGIGISVMPALSLPLGGMKSLVAVPLTPSVQRSIMMIRRRNRMPSPVAERIWSLVRRTIADGYVRSVARAA
jgi:DNA-binding transcriptional LysR family regulator